MLAVDAAIFLLVFLYELFVHVPLLEYSQLLATYHFGFIRRALVGTIVSWFTDVVPIYYVYTIGITAWLVTLVLFVAAFRKVFGLTRKNFPLFVFLLGSPFFFKNFMNSLGYFDIYGCLWALVALLIGVGSLYPLVIAAGCVVLILMNHVHFLLYVPTIGFIVAVRYALAPGLSPGKILNGACLALLLSACFAVSAFFGQVPVPRETFLAYIAARASHPINPDTAYLWYASIGTEIWLTWTKIGHNSLRFPVYAALIAIHIPVIRYFSVMVGALPTRFLQTASIIGLSGITLGYLTIFVVLFDYSRWVSNWAVCMFLAMHAVRLLLPAAPEADAPVRPDGKANLVLGWIATAIPRVGTTIPF
jgi:hypothetical protein